MRKPLLAGSKLPELWVVEEATLAPGRRSGTRQTRLVWTPVSEPAPFLVAEAKRAQWQKGYANNYRIVAWRKNL